MRDKRRFQRLTVLILSLLLIFSMPLGAYAGQEDILSEVRELLRDNYVDPVDERVLQAPTIQEMLNRLGDINTEYFTAEEYASFNDSLNRSFSGIGIELQMVPQGVEVINVYKGYGADRAGIQIGDIITGSGSDSFAGKSSDYCVSKLRGPAGTKVSVTVQRGDQTLYFIIERMQINLPLAEGMFLQNHIGYIAIYSFGEETASQFGACLRELKNKGADCWIIDLRNNGGGYVQAALELLGYFIGDKTAVIAKDRSQAGLAYHATKQAITLEGPAILLTNRYTASASEITAGALKDYEKVTILGERTYGSGRVKALVTLSNGDVLKLPVQRFFSPHQNTIDQTGVSPHLTLAGFDQLSAAVFLLQKHQLADDSPKSGGQGNHQGSDNSDKSGYLRIDAGPGRFVLSLEDLRKPQYWEFGQKILDTAFVATTPLLGAADGWQPLPESLLTDRSKIYYPAYMEAGRLKNIPLNKIFKVTFDRNMDWSTVTAGSVELINAADGERVPCELSFSDKNIMKVTPQTALKAKTEYWLVIHPEIKDASGFPNAGGVAVAVTGEK